MADILIPPQEIIARKKRALKTEMDSLYTNLINGHYPMNSTSTDNRDCPFMVAYARYAEIGETLRTNKITARP